MCTLSLGGRGLSLGVHVGIGGRAGFERAG